MARADLTFNYTNVFSGSSPNGPAPWLTAAFHTVSPGTVTLTLTSHLTTTSQFASEFYFNTDPTGIAPNLLGFSQNSGVAFSSATFGEDCCKADGDGIYDIQINFPTAAGSRFTQGSTAVFTISGDAITESFFNFLSTDAGGSGPFRTAAHVQGIDANPNSGWISEGSIPEPSSLILLGTAAFGLAAWRRRRSSQR